MTTTGTQLDRFDPEGPALAVIETSSIATGLEVADGVLKAAPVELLVSRSGSPGKYFSIFAGYVEEVEAAVDRGLSVAGEDCLDRTLIPHLHPQMLGFLAGEAGIEPVDALGLIETKTVASAIEAADRAAKTAEIRLLRIRFADQLGGKAYFTLTGQLSDVEAAVEGGAAAPRTRRTLIRTLVLPRPDDRLIPFLA